MGALSYIPTRTATVAPGASGTVDWGTRASGTDD